LGSLWAPRSVSKGVALAEVHVRDFQSIRRADLVLGKFTVIQGPSNVGKSALLRAIRMVAQNIPAPRVVVAHGAKSAKAALLFDDGKVAVQRGANLSAFTLNGSTYPKSGQTVPEDVANFLRFVEVEGETLSFAGQHDLPLLLNASSTTVARTFGDLTNVTRILEAVREAVRRRSNVQSLLKVRLEDVETLTDRAAEFRDLPAQQRAVSIAREAYERAVHADEKQGAVRAQVAVVEAAGEALAVLEAEPSLPTIDLAAIEEKFERVTRLMALITTVKNSGSDEEIARNDIASIEQDIGTLAQEHHEMLREAGTCPLCGAKTN
jgi:DNA repair ATPase RecN